MEAKFGTLKQELLETLVGHPWNMSWTVLKQICALNAMVARVWCHLIRMSSKIAKATVILKPPTSAGEAPLQRRRRFAAKARRRNVSGPPPLISYET